MDWFELGRLLYEARIREAWNYGQGGKHAEARLEAHPYPRHPADPDPRCDSAEIQLAQAQAKALLKTHQVLARRMPRKEDA